MKKLNALLNQSNCSFLRGYTPIICGKISVIIVLIIESTELSKIQEGKTSPDPPKSYMYAPPLGKMGQFSL